MVRRSSASSRTTEHRSSERGGTTTTAPQIGDVKITRTEKRRYETTVDNGNAWNGLQIPTVDRTRSRSAHSPRRFASDDDFKSTPSAKHYKGGASGAHDDLYVVGYASVKTQSRPSESDGINYKAFIVPNGASDYSTTTTSTRRSRQTGYHVPTEDVTRRSKVTTHYSTPSLYHRESSYTSLPSYQETSYRQHHLPSPSRAAFYPTVDFDDGLRYKLHSSSTSLSGQRPSSRVRESSISTGSSSLGSSRWSSVPSHLNLIESAALTTYSPPAPSALNYTDRKSVV